MPSITRTIIALNEIIFGDLAKKFKFSCKMNENKINLTNYKGKLELTIWIENGTLNLIVEINRFVSYDHININKLWND